MMFAKKEEKDMCPFLQRPCIGAACHMWTHIRGAHPQTGAELDMFDCSIKWIPILLLENSKESRQTGAAIESFRNEMVRGQQEFTQLFGPEGVK